MIKIRFFTGESLFVKKAAKDKLVEISEMPFIEKYVAVLPDVDYKPGRRAPSGMVLLTKSSIVVDFIGSGGGINCGMSIIKTNIDYKKISAPAMKKLVSEINKRIPVYPLPDRKISAKMLEQVLASGAEYLARKGELSKEEIKQIESNGNVFIAKLNKDYVVKNFSKFLPRKIRKKALHSFGALGGGNHFVEAQIVSEVSNAKEAKKLGLSKNQLLFIIHSDPCTVGNLAYYLNKNPKDDDSFNKEKLAFQMKLYRTSKYFLQNQGPVIINANSDAGKRLITSLLAATNYGFAHRLSMVCNIKNAVRNVFGGSVGVEIISDTSHESINKEIVDGEEYWVHRSGVAKTEISKPMIIPGGMGADSYICVSLHGIRQTFFSINHGVGRSIDREAALTQFSEKETLNKMRSDKIILEKRSKDPVQGESNQSFKDLETVMSTLEQFKLAKRVVKLKPVAIIK